ncbi:GCN5-related N-acetyltransferase [Mycolicibacterium canariasense]|uniref:GCN5-related N-acetyltransferase n=1 Tax=Mycolicibacterium canariasense TaxID=228230 RepID=A0A117IBR2_MYCCR|nr:GNAT family N-acetyltransferase [Mycolicibacterium canariasense]MCV7211813.1 GNAT family N-acetyltransferase [Mycolicibacterium canariasense]GAS98343.1 GCN5-related N-acetyltransferase [Mycolicibacterium canariasense]
MTYTVRIADTGDYQAVAQVHVASWQQAYRGLVADAFLESIDPELWAHRYEARSDDASTMLLAERDQRVIGMVRFGPDRHRAYAGEIYALYVTPGEQRGGVGSALLNAALQHLPQPIVQLWCAAGNSQAQSFYERHGFAADGADDDYVVGECVVPIKRYVLERTGEPGPSPRRPAV